MRDKTYKDALGVFKLKARRRPETGDTLGEWIIVDQTPIFFQPQEDLIEKTYRPPADHR